MASKQPPKKNRKDDAELPEEQGPDASRDSTSLSVVQRGIAVEMRESYLDYAMSVITSRALPDVRDGMKPVHRRILFTMHQMGLAAGGRFRKSAAIVGDVLGKYHPHGDTAVYDALAKLAQDFNTRYPLIMGQGNFGSIDGDSPAAMRYCVVGDTLVPTSQGLVRMSELAPLHGEDISTSVLSFNKTTQRANKFFDSGNHPTRRIRTANGYTLQGTYNHPVLVWGVHPVTGTPRYEWKLLENLQEGDIAVIDRTNDQLWPEQAYAVRHLHPTTLPPRTHRKELPNTLDEDLAFILGALTAEGTLTEHKLEFCNADNEFIAQFTASWERTFPDCRLHSFKRSATSYGKKPYTILEIHSTHVILFLRAVGLVPSKSAIRRIPASVLRSPKSILATFLRAYYEGDGSVSFSSKMNELSACSKSRELLQDIQSVLLRFGLISALREDRARDTFKLYIRGKHAYQLFADEIGFAGVRKREKLKALLARVHKPASGTDFVPHLSTYIRSNLKRSYGSNASHLEKHNFDRYDGLARERDVITRTVVTEVSEDVDALSESLLHTRYFFDPIVSVEEAGEARVYSVRVDSACHSFVGNGFINHNTEAKMSRLSSELLRDIEKETVDWRPNYDSTRNEPVMLPAGVPNLLLNGTLGIAVGMATNIPPHNLREVVAATVHLIDNKKATTDDLLQFIKGPDFPTGAVMFDQKEINRAYATGKGGVVVRGEAEIVEDKRGQFQIVITSIPYRVNKSDLVTKIADLVRDKRLEGIRDLRDESTKDIRVVIELKGTAHPQKVLNYIYKHTQLEDTFHMNIVALADGVPQTLGLKDVLEHFVLHRKNVVRRRCEYDLRKAEDREHILLGLKKALDHIDKIIKLIRAARDVPTAHAALMKEFKFSDRQATAILEMRLQKLAGLERKKIEDELKEVQDTIKWLKDVLGSERKMETIIKKELTEIADKYGDDRRTKLVKGGVKSMTMEDLIPDEEQALVMTQDGYIKRTNPAEFKKQKRGGVGVIDLNTKEEDFVTLFLTAGTHDDLLFFTNLGKAYQIKMYEVPEGRRATKGKSVMNFLSLAGGEQVTSVVAMSKEIKESAGSMMLVTRDGTAKKVKAKDFHDVRRSGLIAMKLASGDELISVQFVDKGDEVILSTAKGQTICFKESDIREMGRTAAGVRGMKVGKGDHIVGVAISRAGYDKKKYELMVLSTNGYGKKTPLAEFKVQKRGGSGVKGSSVTAKTGELMATRIIDPEQLELVVMSKKGQVIRTGIDEIPSQGRMTQGVRMMKLRAGDSVAALICL